MKCENYFRTYSDIKLDALGILTKYTNIPNYFKAFD